MMGNLQNYKPVPDGYEPEHGHVLAVEVRVATYLPESGQIESDQAEYYDLSEIIAIKDEPIKAGDVVRCKALLGTWTTVVRRPTDYKWWIESTSPEPHTGYWYGEEYLERINA